MLNRYLTQTRRLEQLDALAALPLFLSLRAAIRAKVSAERRGHAANVAEAAQSARDYFALAVKLIAPPQPTLIAIGGLSGTGKSVLAGMLAPDIVPAPGAVWLRSDVERKADVRRRRDRAAGAERLHRRDDRASLCRDRRQGCPRRRRRAFGDRRCGVRAKRRAQDDCASRGGRCLPRAVSLSRSRRPPARIGARTADASDADAAVARAQAHYDLGAMDWTLIDASGDPADTLRRTKATLGL